jgi:hypothetical protein
LAGSRKRSRPTTRRALRPEMPLMRDPILLFIVHDGVVTMWLLVDGGVNGG